MGPWGRKHGGLIIHFIVAIYTFLGLAIVCDDYFVAALDRICEGMSNSFSIFCILKDRLCKPNKTLSRRKNIPRLFLF